MLPTLPALDVETELDYVAIAHHVVLAFDADLARSAGRGHRPRGDEILVGHDFGLDEATLEIGVDHACRLRRRGAHRDRPGSRLLRAGREEGRQAQRPGPGPAGRGDDPPRPPAPRAWSAMPRRPAPPRPR